MGTDFNNSLPQNVEHKGRSLRRSTKAVPLPSFQLLSLVVINTHLNPG